ncbi:hypothetical protein LIER_01012 [Lithospermum erythrorhizon]|uniref:Uncharacterized protein n=1 Tax=Lithospermum erythrorhizon TaxID=34254 RepID=A0AAV3NJC9_LITER
MLLLEWYPMQSQGGERVEGGAEIQGDEVQGCEDVLGGVKKFRGWMQVGRGDEFMRSNNVVYDRNEDVDHDDYDYETENFMREDNFDYDTDVELENEDMGMENEDMDHEDSTGMERRACYLDEDEALEDMGPVLNDIEPLPEGSFEYSDGLVDMSEEEEEDVEVFSSSRKEKKEQRREPLFDRHWCSLLIVSGPYIRDHSSETIVSGLKFKD